ncbi:hypothetical protein DV738_g5355, partial [Chaetothyriales sp. CBS 135597]
MTVCRYFQAGNCRFGDRCRFEHPGKQTQPSQNRFGPLQNSDSRKPAASWNCNLQDLKDDLTAGKARPNWILSAYGPGTPAPPASLLQSLECSPEELRVEFYAQAALGNQEAADQQAVQAWNNALKEIKDLYDNAHKVHEFMREADSQQRRPSRYDMCNMDGRETVEQFKASFSQSSAAEASTTTTPFGGGTFGKPAAFGKAGFGASPSSASPFGQQPKSTFGQPSTPAFGSAMFGKPTAAGSAFGQPAFGSSGFGQEKKNPFAPASASSGFGQGGSAFGQPSQPGSVFGQPSQPTSAFGQPSKPTSAFGQPSQVSPFGQRTQQTPAFGQASQPTSAFGKPSQIPAFGQPSQPSSTFGQPSQPGSTFGQPSQPGSTFGQPSQPSSAFGQPSQASSTFGQPSQPSSTFGKPSQLSSTFGQPSQPSPFSNPFGKSDQSTPAFGQPAFGQPSQPSPFSNPFGKSGQPASGFGQPSQPSSAFGKPAFGNAAPSTFGSGMFGKGESSNNTFGLKEGSSTVKDQEKGTASSAASGGNPFAKPPSAPTSAFETAQPQHAAQVNGASGQGLNSITGKSQNRPQGSSAPVIYAQTLPTIPSEKDNSGRLTFYRGQPVTYKEEPIEHDQFGKAKPTVYYPCYERPDTGDLEKIWFPEGANEDQIKHLNKDTKRKDLEAEDDEYTEEIRKMYEYLKLEGAWRDGKVPLVPPMRQWVDYDF